MKYTVSVVIPVYGASEGLIELNQRIETSLNACEMVHDFEIIYVNDASPVQSLKYLKTILQSRKNVVLVDLMKNVGQLRATAIGMGYASGQLIVTIDDDLQQNPEDIEVLLGTLINEDLDLVVAKFERSQHSIFRRIASRAARFLAIRYLHVRKNVEFSSFCVIRRAVYDNYFNGTQRIPIPGWMYRTTNHYGSALVQHSQRLSGKSTYTLKSLVRIATPFLSVVSDFILKIIVIFGLLLLASSIFGAMYFIVQYLQDDIKSPGYTSIVILLLANLGLTGSLVSACALYMQSIKRLFVGQPESYVRSIQRS